MADQLFDDYGVGTGSRNLFSGGMSEQELNQLLGQFTPRTSIAKGLMADGTADRVDRGGSFPYIPFEKEPEGLIRILNQNTGRYELKIDPNFIPFNSPKYWAMMQADADQVAANGISQTQFQTLSGGMKTDDPTFALDQTQPSAPTSVMGMFPEVEAMQRALYQQKQNEAMQAQAMQFARLSPMERAQYSLYMGGQQLGGAIGGALGAKDPQMQMISLQNQMLRMVDPNKPETYDRAISLALQTGDRNTALILNDEKKNAQVRKTQALDTYAQQLLPTLKNADGTINEQVKSQLLAFPQGRAAITELAKTYPSLRTIGAAGGQEEDPFKIFIDDETTPESVKISARQYSDSFKKGTIDLEKVDGIVTKLAESTQRVQQFNQNQQTIKDNQATLAEFRKQGLDNTSGFLAIAKSNNALAQQNAAFTRQEKIEKARAAAEKAKDGKEIKFGDATKLANQSEGVDKLIGISDSFKPEFAGYATDYVGEAAVLLAGKSSDPDNVALYQWWQGYQDHVNRVRNELFGAALTAPEKAEFEKAMVTKGMNPAQAQANLKRQAEQALKAYEKLEKVLRVGGYSNSQLDSLKPSGFNTVTPSPVDIPAGVTVKKK